jgi:hypothetical protein
LFPKLLLLFDRQISTAGIADLVDEGSEQRRAAAKASKGVRRKNDRGRSVISLFKNDSFVFPLIGPSSRKDVAA